MDIPGIVEGLKRVFTQKYGSHITISNLKDITVGWETQIIAFDLEENGKQHELVARIFSSDQTGNRAAEEFIVMQRLHDTGYPVPKVYFYEKDPQVIGSPFLIMERIEGGVLWDVFFNSSHDKKDEVMDLSTKLMVDLHSIDPSKVFKIKKGYTTKNRINDRLSIESKTLIKFGLHNRFKPLIDWLTVGLSELVESPLCILHGDFHPRNILLRKGASPVVIDWSSCSLGDFREDLCWTGLLAYAFINSELKNGVYKSYHSYSSRSIDNLQYFEVFSGLRRLSDFGISMKAGAEARGMRAEASSQMYENRAHVEKIRDIILEITGLNLKA